MNAFWCLCCRLIKTGLTLQYDPLLCHILVNRTIFYYVYAQLLLIWPGQTLRHSISYLQTDKIHGAWLSAFNQKRKHNLGCFPLYQTNQPETDQLATDGIYRGNNELHFPNKLSKWINRKNWEEWLLPFFICFPISPT